MKTTPILSDALNALPGWADTLAAYERSRAAVDEIAAAARAAGLTPTNTVAADLATALRDGKTLNPDQIIDAAAKAAAVAQAGEIAVAAAVAARDQIAAELAETLRDVDPAMKRLNERMVELVAEVAEADKALGGIATIEAAVADGKADAWQALQRAVDTYSAIREAQHAIATASAAGAPYALGIGVRLPSPGVWNTSTSTAVVEVHRDLERGGYWASHRAWDALTAPDNEDSYTPSGDLYARPPRSPIPGFDPHASRSWLPSDNPTSFLRWVCAAPEAEHVRPVVRSLTEARLHADSDGVEVAETPTRPLRVPAHVRAEHDAHLAAKAAERRRERRSPYPRVVVTDD